VDVMKLEIKKGDVVKVIAGDDKGKEGRVLDIFPKDLRILVEGVNEHKRHTRPNQGNQQGGILTKSLPIHYSNVKLVSKG